MSKKIQAIRGMNDYLPNETHIWQYIERKIGQVLDSYCYKEIRLPVVEKTDLFCRTIGEVTDIVEKEMYTFEDRNGESLSLRPEGTAGCVRACIEHGLLHNQQQRLWYAGNMFRYEKPQKDRYRQFNQIGVETYGIETPDIDAELIMLSAAFWKSLGITGVELQLNSLGSNESREKYREVIVEYFKDNYEMLDEDSRRRLDKNPLRILDSKNPDMASLIKDAPTLIEYLDEESADHFEKLQSYLKSCDIEYVINPRLVRGLDYYNRTVFEWVTNLLGAQGTICAGGRYDSLVEQIGGRDTPAVGFAMGVERVISLVKEVTGDVPQKLPFIYVVATGEKGEPKGFSIVNDLRKEFPDVAIMQNAGGGSFKSQFKRADKSGASLAIIVGDDEADQDVVSIKYLRERKDQETIPLSLLNNRVKDFL